MGSHQKKLGKLAAPEEAPSDTASSGATSGKNVKNLSILSVSIAATAALSMIMRMYIPRVLGVEALGQFQFAEQLAMFLFGFMSFGIGAYINKYVPPKPSYSKDITFTIAVFQSGVSVALLGVLVGVFLYIQRPQQVFLAAVLMAGWAYSETIQVSTFKKMYIVLDKIKRVGTLNVIQKAIQVVCVVASLLISGTIVDLALAYFASSMIGYLMICTDLIRMGVLRFNFSWTLLKDIIRHSLPYFFGLILISAFQSTDTIILSLVGNDTETGYFSAAFRLIGVLMIIVPALDSAFIPSQSKNFVYDKPLFALTLENIVSFLLVLSLGCSLVLGLFSELIVSTLFGPGFEKSYKIVSYLAPVLSLTYINTVLGSSLNIATTGKVLSIIMAGGLSINVIANYLVVPLGMSYWGEGGGGLAVAITTILSELLIAIAILMVFPVKLNVVKIYYRIFMVAFPSTLLLVFYDNVSGISVAEKLGLLLVVGPCYILLFRVVSLSDISTALRAVRSIFSAKLGR